MKNLNPIKALFAIALLSFVFVIDGCKKDTVKPTTIAPVTVGTGVAPDSANYLRGYLGTDIIKFEGNAIAYNGYIDPDSAQNHGGSANGQDNDAYYMNGSKWVAISSLGLQSTNATVELRSLAVRVFVSPIQAQSSTYYGLLQDVSYEFSTNTSPGKGAYVSLYDKYGVLWTSSGNQDGSSLLVNYVGPSMGTYAVVSGLISCKMYDPNGNMKQLTGATFTAALGI
jgi:hypothetical protein